MKIFYCEYINDDPQSYTNAKLYTRYGNDIPFQKSLMKDPRPIARLTADYLDGQLQIHSVDQVTIAAFLTDTYRQRSENRGLHKQTIVEPDQSRWDILDAEFQEGENVPVETSIAANSQTNGAARFIGDHADRAVAAAAGMASESVTEGKESISVNAGFRGYALAREKQSAAVARDGISHSEQEHSIAVTLKGSAITSAAGSTAVADTVAHTAAAGSLAYTNPSDDSIALSDAAGKQSIAVTKGTKSRAVAHEDHSVAIVFDSTDAQSKTESDHSVSIASGSNCKAVSTGANSLSIAIGSDSPENGASATADGTGSIALGVGPNCSARGSLGSFLVLAEWRLENETYQLKDVRSVQVDGETIKPDVFYELKDGEITEVQEYRPFNMFLR